VEPAALAGLLTLTVAAGALALMARRVDRQVSATATAVSRLRLLRQAVEALRSESAITHRQLDHTGETLRHQHRR
jgi:hypothetical protein